MTDQDLMPFGKYKGTAMANVPAEYLVWAKNNFTVNKYSQPVLDYINENWDAIQKEIKKQEK